MLKKRIFKVTKIWYIERDSIVTASRFSQELDKHLVEKPDETNISEKRELL